MTAEKQVFMVVQLIQQTKSGNMVWTYNRDPSFGESYRSRWRNWTHVEITKESDEILYCKIYDHASGGIEIIGFDSSFADDPDYNCYDSAICARLDELWVLLQSFPHVVK